MKTIGNHFWIAQLLNSALYQSWFNNDHYLRVLQTRIINISCLVLIGANLLVGLISISASYELYGIISLIAVSILLLSKSGMFQVSRWAFITGLNVIVFLCSAINVESILLNFLFILIIIASLLLFAKEEKLELAISLTIPVFCFILIQLTNFHFTSHQLQASELFNNAFLINIVCILLSVLLAIFYVFLMYERSNNKLRILVDELQVKEKEIKLQNEELTRVNANLTVSQEELIKSQSFLNNVIDNLPVMLFVKEATSLKLVRLNKTGERMLKYSEEEMLARSNFELFSQEQAEVFRQADLEVLSKGTIIEQEELITSKNKETYILNTKKVPIHDSKGKPLYLLGISEDITPRKQAEETLKKTVEELRVRNYELDNYVYRVSHDLRAPFCSMQGLINLAKNESNLDLLKEYFNLIEKSIIKSDRFIQSILDHSKILNADLQVTLIDFEKLIQDSFQELEYITGAAQIEHIVHIGEGKFYSDEFRIAIILKNIISNAIRYTKDTTAHKLINIDIAVSDKQARISITDNGVGIEKEHLPKIFDMFFRGSEKSSGSGLGLYIARQAIEKLGGEITAESELGKGASFKIILNNYTERKV